MLETICGHTAWVHRYGAGDPRLMIHCSLARHETLLPLDKEMPPAATVVFDLPGHGRSGDWHGSDYQTDTVEIAAGLLDGPAHIVGHSFGATVALRLAVERPDLVARLTLIEPVMFAAARGTDAHAMHQNIQRPFVDAWQAGNQRAATRAFLDMWGDGRPWNDLSSRKQAALTALIHLIPAAAPAIEDDIHNILERLSDVACPVDMIAGGDSPAIMSAILDGLAARLPQAKRHIVRGAGHMVAITHPDKVAASLSRL